MQNNAGKKLVLPLGKWGLVMIIFEIMVLPIFVVSMLWENTDPFLLALISWIANLLILVVIGFFIAIRFIHEKAWRRFLNSAGTSIQGHALDFEQHQKVNGSVYRTLVVYANQTIPSPERYYLNRGRFRFFRLAGHLLGQKSDLQQIESVFNKVQYRVPDDQLPVLSQPALEILRVLMLEVERASLSIYPDRVEFMMGEFTLDEVRFEAVLENLVRFVEELEG